MSSFVKVARREQEMKWAWIWFKQFSSFHGHGGESKWEFSANHVIEFLQSKRDASVPAWKRMSIIEGLILFREEVQRRESEDLLPLQTKMVDIIAIERAMNGGFDSIEDAAGVIDPNEPDAIQAFRRALRKDGRALETERSYVGKLRKFMAAARLIAKVSQGASRAAVAVSICVRSIITRPEDGAVASTSLAQGNVPKTSASCGGCRGAA